jgi:hypothetical protein
VLVPSIGIKVMNSILKIGKAKTVLILAVLSFMTLLFVYLMQSQKPDEFLFGAKWSLDELEQQFIGALPKSAMDIEYQSLANYALLSFKASPQEVLEFAKRFCYGSLIAGYDPFNSIDTDGSNGTYLIQTNPEYFYFSHSINNLDTQLGNRCSDIQRGGLHQIVVYTQDDNLYEVKLEISGTCTNQNAPHPCDGIAIAYTNQGSIELSKSYSIQGRYTEGDSWEISLEPDKQYKLIVKPKDIEQNQSRSDYQVSVIPTLTSGNEPYCEACWINTHGSSQQILEINFAAPSWGLSNIRLFWMGVDQPYEISVVENI